METLTLKGRGRPRKNPPVFEHAGENKNAPEFNVRDGQIGSLGVGAQANIRGASWRQLVDTVVSYKSWKNTVAMAFHPEPEADLIEAPCGFVRVAKGEPLIVLNSGEEVRITPSPGGQ